jgi:hypothetical protein
MLADSTRYLFDKRQPRRVPFWAARACIIPASARAEGAGRGTVDIACLFSRKAASVAGPFKIQLDRSRFSIREMLQERCQPLNFGWLDLRQQRISSPSAATFLGSG